MTAAKKNPPALAGGRARSTVSEDTDSYGGRVFDVGPRFANELARFARQVGVDESVGRVLWLLAKRSEQSGATPRCYFGEYLHRWLDTALTITTDPAIAARLHALIRAWDEGAPIGDTFPF